MTEAISDYAGNTLTALNTRKTKKQPAVAKIAFLQIEDRKESLRQLNANLLAEIDRKLKELYRASINDVDDKIDALAWDSGFNREVWWRAIHSPDLRYDLQAIAARIFTQAAFPKCSEISYPRVQNPIRPDHTNWKRIVEMASNGTLLVPLGVVEGLDRVSDFQGLRAIRSKCRDADALERLDEILAEAPNG